MLDSFPKEEELSHKFSKAFEKKMNKLIKGEKRTPFMRSVIVYGKRAAAIVLIVLSITFVTTMSVEAYRVKFFEVITKVWEEFTSITFKSEEEVIDRKLVAINPEYIPEGFSILEETLSDYVNKIIYVNMIDEEIIYEQRLISDGEIIFDTEGIEIKTMDIENETISFFTNKGVSQIYWNDDLYMYRFSSTIDMEEIIKMTKSILKNNKNILN
ncbi:DUF4367 domain-containing protein [Tissierella creatinophila]|uniref:DUF4367 domain-containing protein n=1 Tax=Tissierella creatinophila DSM 6911 TaxID=1123403 RepID=A0A1U7M592_TISCR|nr:DUF4367 domain-containing protein [Tissierella creatinophila]OLS02456.1 hypothetical protein TICRE_15740 [Tissierella creatinophila DSM 6911]